MRRALDWIGNAFLVAERVGGCALGGAGAKLSIPLPSPPLGWPSATCSSSPLLAPPILQHATHTVCFAQLEVAGKQHGVHAFVVNLREGGRLCRGVRIADCGHKVG